MEHIVLSVDGSAPSTAALPWVASRARREVAHVDVVSVVSKQTTDRSRAWEHLADAEALLREKAPGTGVDLHRLESGSSDALTVFAADADLLVVGVNPGHPIHGVLAGAPPVRISARAHAPVVMVPAGWVEIDGPVTVGIADDGSSHAAIAFAAGEAATRGAPLRLVHSWLMPTPSFSGSAALPTTPESVSAKHRRLLQRAAAWVSGSYPDVEVHSELVRDSRSAALLRFAPRSSMLVIGTHRRGTHAGSLLGSVAQEVLWQVDCPVIVVQGSDDRGEG